MALVHHLASKNLAEEKYCSQVDVDDGIPIFYGEIHSRSTALHACVVDEDIDMPKGGECGVQGFLRPGFRANIECQGKETPACIVDRLRPCVSVRGVLERRD